MVLVVMVASYKGGQHSTVVVFLLPFLFLRPDKAQTWGSKKPLGFYVGPTELKDEFEAKIKYKMRLARQLHGQI